MTFARTRFVETRSEVYQLEKRIGHGASAIIYAATNSTRRKVAIKLAFDESKNDLIENEAEALALTGKNTRIVQLIDKGKTEGKEFLVLEHIEGHLLETLMRLAIRFPVGVARYIGIDICKGVYDIHKKNVIHRDLKPKNIMMTTDGRVKIIDFGIAAIVDDKAHRRLMTGAGTPSSMAPEQLSGDEDKRADIYAIGTMLYTMTCGRKPFMDTDVRAVVNALLNAEPVRPRIIDSTIDPIVEDIILTCLRKKPGERFQNTTELTNALLGITGQDIDPTVYLRTKVIEANSRLVHTGCQEPVDLTRDTITDATQ